jgi:hypothetical protein
MTSTPDVLFHYTTIPGIIGIATNRQLWATSIRHLADAKEFSYAHQMLASTLRDRASTSTQDIISTVDAILVHLTRQGESKLSFSGSLGSIFVISFSREGDLLSQWRAYCPSGGYALGFRSEILLKLATEQGFELRQCSYDEEEHRRECERITATVLTAVADVPVDVRESLIGTPTKISIQALQALYPIQHKVVHEIQAFAPVWKHPSFREEAEWRLVSKPLERPIKYRPGRTAIVRR